MRKFFMWLILLPVLFSLTGCATLYGRRQTITVTSDVDRAKVWKGKKFMGETPLTFKTRKAKSTISVGKDGYEKQQINADIEFRPIGYLNLFNYLGFIVDAITGTSKRYITTDYFVSLKDPEINRQYNEEHLNYKVIRSQNIAEALTVTSQHLATQIESGDFQDVIAQNAKVKQLEEEQRRLEYERTIQKSSMRAQQTKSMLQARETAVQQEKTNQQARAYNSLTTTRSTPTGPDNDWFTADDAWNQQVYQWFYQYGYEKTKELVEQYRASRYNQVSQTTSIGFESQPNQMVISRAAGMNPTERVVSAVTANRKMINIKVLGDYVIAYNGGYNNPNASQPQWTNIVKAPIDKTSDRPDVDLRLRNEFSHTAVINGTRVYFNFSQANQSQPNQMVTSRTTGMNPTERVVSAVTANRKMINIKVLGDYVIAYNGGYNNPNASQPQWTNIVKAPIDKTSDRPDVDLRLRNEFSHTAVINGTRIYFNL